MTATVVHVTNLTPGSANPNPGRRRRRHGVRQPADRPGADAAEVQPGVPATAHGHGLVLHLQRHLPPQRRIEKRQSDESRGGL
jgi:hypothetical protein